MGSLHTLKTSSGPEPSLSRDQDVHGNVLDSQRADQRADPVVGEVVIQTEAIAQRQRHIQASLWIPHPCESIWRVLTDYDALASFLPNLSKCQRLPHPTGGIRLEQIGSQRLLRVNFSARVVLDLDEVFPSEVRFTLVEGDFKQFEGCWRLTRSPLPQHREATTLSYQVLVWPRRTMPVGLIERRLCQDLSANLLAIAARVAEMGQVSPEITEQVGGFEYKGKDS